MFGGERCVAHPTGGTVGVERVEIVRETFAIAKSYSDIVGDMNSWHTLDASRDDCFVPTASGIVISLIFLGSAILRL